MLSAGLRVLVWNTQDWKWGWEESDTSRKRGKALTEMLKRWEPHLVVLLETGTASKPNLHVDAHVRNAVDLFYTKVTACVRDDFRTDHDKCIAYFYDTSLSFGQKSYPIESKKERRPTLLLELKKEAAGFKPGTTFAFSHSIAQSTESAKQVSEALMAFKGWDLAFYGGDLNHSPPSLPDEEEEEEKPSPSGMDIEPVARRLRPRKPSTWEALPPDEPTHGVVGNGDPKTLDWAYLNVGICETVSCYAETIATVPPKQPTPPLNGYVHVWKGETKDGASDHAAVLYTLRAKKR